ncbi:hypothetical protein BDW74DRAFT_156364 [Aspergillus multicolor]|uniref:uncharacterized protein n=1 Tax=Aspergillus multicolor TaxID=41759 RepID=UPI003CCE4F3D
MPEADAYDAGDEGDSETDPSSSSSSSSSDDDDDDTSPLPANDTDLQTWETVILARVHALEDVTWETFLKVLIFHAVVILLWTCFPAT